MVERQVDETLVRDLSDVFVWSSGIIQDRVYHLSHTPGFYAVEHISCRGCLYVFDWEFARTDWVPFEDAFHFVLQKGILVDHTQESLLWERLTADATLEGKFLRDLVASIGVGEDVYYSLLALYLVDIVTTYALHQTGTVKHQKTDKSFLAAGRPFLPDL
jgi:hypothetical protein